MKCRFCGHRMVNDVCPFCGYEASSKSSYNHEYEMSKFRSRAADKIAEIDFPSFGKKLEIKEGKKMKTLNIPDHWTPKRKIYRARYTGGRGAWVTTIWRRTEQEAKDDIMMFASNPQRYGFDGVEIISMDYDEYLKEHQRAPKF